MTSCPSKNDVSLRRFCFDFRSANTHTHTHTHTRTHTHTHTYEHTLGGKSVCEVARIFLVRYHVTFLLRFSWASLTHSLSHTHTHTHTYMHTFFLSSIFLFQLVLRYRPGFQFCGYMDLLDYIAQMKHECSIHIIYCYCFYQSELNLLALWGTYVCMLVHV